MTSNRLTERLARYLSKNRSSKLIAAAAALAAIAIFLITSGAFDIGGEKKQLEPGKTQTQLNTDPTALLESKLEQMLSKMHGVGRARVMVTLEKGTESIVAVEQKTVTGEKSSTSEIHPATLQSGGKEDAIVLTEVLPRVRGVLVIADGAENITVRCNISAAVSTVLGIDESLVEVFAMSSG